MKADELKKKYIDFFVKKKHKKLPNVSLVPEDISSSALFISAGMHPLIPNLIGEPHSLGKRLVSNQRCLRTADIEEVGDPLHLTFFEMLGNWSLGDYWKEKAISWSLEFLTQKLKIPSEKLHVTCFAGNKDAPKDEESARIWKKLGIPQERIYFFDKKENWWGPVEKTGPCGPDTEMFIDMGGKCRLGKKNCDPRCQCGKYFEIWNNVFMEYNKTRDGKYEPLKQRNVDTGMGVERVLSVLQGVDDIFQITDFKPIIKKIEEVSGKKYEGENKKAMRIIADHLRAAVFVIADGIVPSNVEQGYVLRRLIRRSIRYGHLLQIAKPFASQVAEAVVDIYQKDYTHLGEKKKEIFQQLFSEEGKFSRALERGLKEFEKLSQKVRGKRITGQQVFYLYETYGFPLEMTEELALKKKLSVDKRGFEQARKEHQKKSRASLKTKFVGGLADRSKEVTKLHTATHLLHQALRDVLGEHVKQMGSNVTSERLRFDFTHPEKLTDEQIKKVEKIVNQKIKKNLSVKMKMMVPEQAQKLGALAFFSERYGEKVKVYSIGNFSKEVCGGPHVDFTGEIGGVKITREKPVGAGRRRIYAKLAHGS